MSIGYMCTNLWCRKALITRWNRSSCACLPCVLTFDAVRRWSHLDLAYRYKGAQACTNLWCRKALITESNWLPITAANSVLTFDAVRRWSRISDRHSAAGRGGRVLTFDAVRRWSHTVLSEDPINNECTNLWCRKALITCSQRSKWRRQLVVY